MQNDLTQGNLLTNIFRFSIPFFLSYFLQTLYGMGDLFIVGQYNGAEVISAVSIGSQIMHMLTVIVVGLAMGTTVMIGHFVGAKEEAKKTKTIGNSFTLFIGLSLILTGLCLIGMKAILQLLATPAPSYQEAQAYLKVCFLGIPFIVLYNVFSSIFRGLGDSKSPMLFIGVACVLNIGLDLLLIGPLGMRAAGAAYATVLAQAGSVLFAIFHFRKMHMHLRKEDFKVEKATLLRILKVGFPIMLQDGLIQISFLIITMIANQRGVQVAAAVGIVEKIISFLFLVPSSMLSTVFAIASQSMGANLLQRAQKTLFYCIGITLSYGFVVAILFQCIAGGVVGLFTHDSLVIHFQSYRTFTKCRGLFTHDSLVIHLGTQYLRAYVLDCMAAGVHFCFSGFFAATGYSMVSFIHNITSIIVARIPGAYFACKLFPDTLFPMGLAAPIGGLVSIVICVIAYHMLVPKLLEQTKRENCA